MHFEFSTVSKIIFGPGSLASIDDIVSKYGSHILVISGAPDNVTNKLLDLLRFPSRVILLLKVDKEPTVDTIRAALDQAHRVSPEVIIGIGGGSTIDTSKVVSALLANPGDITDYLEVIGDNNPLLSPSLPLIVVPTTAGTGAEATRNAVVGSPIDRVKVSIRSPFILPRVALIDPQLTIPLPPYITAITGMDALTQLIEPFTSNSSNPFTDALCKEGIQRIANSFYKAYDQGTDLGAREDMSVAALFSGISLANAKLGAVHGFAGPIGGEIPAQHGAICATLLANVMEGNISALKSRSPEHPVLERYAMIGRLLCNDPCATAEDGIRWIRKFQTHSGILSLSQLGLTEELIPRIVEKAQKASSMKGNPIPLNEEELRMILRKSL